jgi:hypothetical protein
LLLEIGQQKSSDFSLLQNLDTLIPYDYYVKLFPLCQDSNIEARLEKRKFFCEMQL